jgi:hypothetical protein
MKFYTDIEHVKNKIILNNEVTDYPPNPVNGQIAFVDGVLYIYSTIDGTETWYPLTTKAEYHVHQQVTAASTWNIQHNLKTKNIAYFVYDGDDVYQISDITFIDDNNATINLTEETDGRAILFAASNAYSAGAATIVYVDKYAEKQKNHGDVAGTVNISLDEGMVHLVTCTDDVTFTFSGWATGDRSSGVSLVITNGGGKVTWPANVVWPDGTEPALTVTGLDRLVFVSDDGGVTVQGFVSGTNLS